MRLLYARSAGVEPPHPPDSFKPRTADCFWSLCVALETQPVVQSIGAEANGHGSRSPSGIIDASLITSSAARSADYTEAGLVLASGVESWIPFLHLWESRLDTPIDNSPHLIRSSPEFEKWKAQSADFQHTAIAGSVISPCCHPIWSVSLRLPDNSHLNRSASQLQSCLQKRLGLPAAGHSVHLAEEAVVAVVAV